MDLSTGDILKDLRRWKKSFLAHIQTLSYADNTIDLYRRVIDRFIEYARGLQDEADIADLNRGHFIEFLEELDNESRKKRLKPLSKSTKNTYIKAIRAFFTYISDNNDQLFTYERFFRRLKVADTSRREESLRYLNDDEIGRFFAALEEAKRNSAGIIEHRDALFFKLLFYGGLRASEALGLRPSDFEKLDDFYRISIVAKGGKRQFAYVPVQAIEGELAYLGERTGSGEFLFRTRNGHRLDRHAIYRKAEKMFAKAGIFGKRGLHILRHSLAMRLVKNGTDLLHIQKTLRHASIQTTTVYAKAEESGIMKALREIAK